MNVMREDPRVASFISIVTREARKLAYGNPFTADDLAQEGIIAAMRALESYDPCRGNLGGYVRICARNRMISYLRRNGHESPMEDDVLDAHLSARDESFNQNIQQEAFEKREALYELLKRLSPFETETLGAYLREGGVSGTARALRCDRKKVDNALQRIRNKARALDA
ncbi:MAG: sigma-70 family RNA polymerase sigma factor [Synergistaceae bacterium]|jgi:RNA polymerase sporulation-specific sigma factor|nr:sigma-70 family RNA polymerase sigma factor [Synergistaceae bacterium]